MKKSGFSDSQIMAMLKQAENGVPGPNLCREHGMSTVTFYKWRSKFGGMDASMMVRLKELKDENRRLEKMYGEERIKSDLRQEALEKKWWCWISPARGTSATAYRFRSSCSMSITSKPSTTAWATKLAKRPCVN